MGHVLHYRNAGSVQSIRKRPRRNTNAGCRQKIRPCGCLLLRRVRVDFDHAGCLELWQPCQLRRRRRRSLEIGDAVVHGAGEVGQIILLQQIPDLLANCPLPCSGRRAGCRACAACCCCRRLLHAALHLAFCLHCRHGCCVSCQPLGIVRSCVKSASAGGAAAAGCRPWGSAGGPLTCGESPRCCRWQMRGCRASADALAVRGRPSAGHRVFRSLAMQIGEIGRAHV